MAFTYGFYDSLAGDRKYTATQLSSLFKGIITDGIFASIGGNFAVTGGAGTMVITVAPGRAWFNNTWTNSDANMPLTVAASEAVLNRIDSVILEVNSDLGVRANSIKMLKGTPSSTPVAPTLANTSTLHQYALADIYVGANVTQITSGNITNRIGTTGTPWIGGAVSTIDASMMYARLEAQFNTWYNNLVNQLSGSQVTNLQAQLDILNNGRSGWTPLSATLSYSSLDSPVGVISANADLTNILYKGMRLSYQQDQALTAYWNLDANSNSQVGSFNGTDTAITYAAGKFSNAAGFNGTTSKIVITDHASLKPTGDFTIGAWFKTNNTGAEKLIVQSYSVNPTNTAGISIRINPSNTLEMLIAKNTGTSPGADYINLVGATVVTDNNWHYVVCTFRNNYLQIYLDGKLEVAGYSFAPVYGTSNNVRIGCKNVAGTDASFFNGQIDDVFLINGYALDEKTIADKYNASSAQGTATLSLVKHGIVVNVGTYSGGVTLLTVYGGTDHSLVNGTITNPKYSNVKAPYGFSLNSDKWTVNYTDVVTRTQAPTPATWYNLGGAAITIPIGLWSVGYSVLANVTKATATICQPYTTLSNANNTESDLSTTFANGINSVLAYSSMNVVKGKIINLTAKKTYYLNAKTNVAVDSINFYNGSSALVITAKSEYL